MGSQYDLHAGIQFHYQVDEPFLPLDVQAHLGFVHEQHVGLSVLHEHRQQDCQHLLFAAAQLVGHQSLANLRETDFVLRAYNLLTRFLKEVIDHVLEAFLRLRQLLCGICVSLLQFDDDTVADVHLVIQILPLQVVQLEVERRRDARIHVRHRVEVKYWRIQ